MARTKTKLFYERMRDARLDAGLVIDEVSYRIRDIAPAHWRRSSRATVNRLEQPSADEAKADPVLLQVLAVIYGVPLAELSKTAAEQFDRIVELPTLSISDMWPYTQLSMYLDDLFPDDGAREQWTIRTSSTDTGPLNGHAACRPPRSAATARSTRRSVDGWSDAA